MIAKLRSTSLFLIALGALQIAAFAETVTFDILPAQFPSLSSVNVELEGPLLIGSDSDNSALGGEAIIELDQTSEPFQSANLDELTLELIDGMDLSLAFGAVSVTAQPGMTRVNMLDPGFPTPVVDGTFTQEAAVFQFEGHIDLSTQEEPFDLESVAPIAVDLEDIRIFEENNQLVAELTVDLQFSAAIAVEGFGQVPLAIRIQGGARALAARAVAGDVNQDGLLNVADIDALAAAIRDLRQDEVYDVDGNGSVDANDHRFLIEQSFETFFGDANLDGEFNSSDLVNVFQAGEYQDQVAGNSSWATGDWSGDAEFDSGDIVLAFQASGYEQGPRNRALAVPEPSCVCMALVFAGVLFRRRWDTVARLGQSGRARRFAKSD